VPLSRSRDYLSIGEVLEAIRGDFPDVSISKIRFLENEGLIAPARTGSGYRKFYEDDVARLRYILSLQRDHFLPLRVIREKLSEREANGSREASAPLSSPAGGRASEAAASSTPPEEEFLPLEREELRRRAGVTESQLADLEEFGMLGRPADGSYDATDLALVEAAAGLFAYGVQARHLTMFKQSAERETALLSQLVAPLAAKRDPHARAEAERMLERMADLTRRLRAALLQHGLDHAL
jgi:DNA-binding transcriptional MerR regulator